MTTDEVLAEKLAELSIKSTTGVDKAHPVEAAGTVTSDTNSDLANADMDGLLRLISGVNASIYEIEELRHAGPSHRVVIDSRLADLDGQIKGIEPRIVKLMSETPDTTTAPQPDDAEELREQWTKTTRQHALLKEELRDDGWLVRFRSTAEQAEAMMAPMQKSLDECLAFLNATPSIPVAMNEGAEADHAERLGALASSHDAMKRTYVPSVTKILKMMNKHMQARSTRNGEALRRLGELEARWVTLSRQLQQLDAKFRIAVSRQAERDMIKSDSGEVLVETASVLSSPTPDYFGLPPSASSSSHRSSMSSSHSAAQQQVKASLGLGRAKSPARAEGERTIRRQSSNISNATAVTDRPPWKVGSRPVPPPVPAVPTMYHGQTPQHRRLSSYGTRPHDLRSPSPSASSQTSISRASASGSKLPVRSPTAKTRADATHLAAPPHPAPLDRQLTSPAAFQTPPRPRQSVPASLPRSTTPLMGTRSVSHGMVPRTEPVRRTLGRNPPSSFRAQTPTPSRPSSRMSANSFAPPTAALQPFQPSKYDMLDQEVARIISEVGFNLLTARLDAPLKKGQRRRDDEEWKGEYVFGAGERSSSVKLLKLVGRGVDGAQSRTKCMCRVAGAWHDLATVLRDRLARATASPPPSQFSP